MHMTFQRFLPFNIPCICLTIALGTKFNRPLCIQMLSECINISFFLPVAVGMLPGVVEEAEKETVEIHSVETMTEAGGSATVLQDMT